MPESVDTALILAGGSSVRFRETKALVEFAGKPMVQHVFDAVSPLAEEVIVSVATKSMEDALRPFLSDAEFVIDRRRGRGPIEGIRRGTEVARGERLLVAPCDSPLLRPELYRLLVGMLGGHDAAVPKLDVVDPVRAVYRRSRVAEVLRGSPTIGSPSALVDRLDSVFVGADRLRQVDPYLSSFLDVNTREDLELALQRKRMVEQARQIRKRPRPNRSAPSSERRPKSR
jgi:molybdopterin-guanine dinucleotide biosynthesis protein A